MTQHANKMLTDKYSNDTIQIDSGEEIRCPYCKKLLLKGRILQGAIEIPCTRCREGKKKPIKFRAM